MGLAYRGAGYGKSIGAEGITVSSSAVGVTPTAGAKAALITVGDEPVRFRTDGVSPTASVGHKAVADAAIEVFGDDMTNIELIAVSSDSVVFVTYFGE